MEEIKGWESWPGRPQRLHTRVRRDYVLAFGSFFQRMGLRDVPLWRLDLLAMEVVGSGLSNMPVHSSATSGSFSPPQSGMAWGAASYARTDVPCAQWTHVGGGGLGS